MKYKKEKFIEQIQNKNGWTFRVNINLKDHRVSKYFKESDYGSSRRAFENAVIFRDQTLNEIKTNRYFEPKDIPLKKVFEETFTMYPVREETKRKHLIYFKKYFPEITIGDVTTAVVTESLNAMITRCSNDTIARALSIWRRIVKTGIMKNYIQKDPTLEIVAPKSVKIKSRKREFVTTRETVLKVEQILAEKIKNGDIVADAIELMWFTGMRPAECFALSPDDIHDDHISVNKELGSGISLDAEIDSGNCNIVRQCKTEASVRDIPITFQMEPLIRKLKCIPGKILFSNDGQYFNMNSLGQLIHHYCKGFNMYQLRHTLATDLVTKCFDQRTIQEILGHENFGMSVYYARSNDDLKRKAMEQRS